ncbi:MAG: diadenylate cyclase [Elusimicrobia bacterium]|nr:diadenylate cyclase [Elusimicrobiota bacterium]
MNLVRAPGLADILDIACVTLIIYSFLVWFKRARAAFVARGLLILAGFYVFARLMDMRMTIWIFQGFFAVLIIAIVVIFQEEIRHFFERLALWSFKRGGGDAPDFSRELEILVRTAGTLAHAKVGALIVLKGRDPLERHAEGGWSLNGEISEAILESIFDYHSLGHDGAVLLEGGRLTRFGAHLPLSRDFSKLSGFGTRHSAALGLAEKTDALSVVISEEKGPVSVARDGNLRALEGLEELHRELESFYRDKAPAPLPKDALHFIRHNTREKLVALGIAVLLWILLVAPR